MLKVNGTLDISPGPRQREFASLLAEIAWKYPEAVLFRATSHGDVWLEDESGTTVTFVSSRRTGVSRDDREEALLRSCLTIAAVHPPSEPKDKQCSV